MSEILERLRSAFADRYRLDRQIGEGGMATVYLGEDLKHHRPIALKVLRPELAALLGPERFLREIELAARLNHPHILPLYDSGAAGDLLYYVMPFVAGASLRERLDREKQLPVADALRITREVADALDYAHRHGVVHRDIKPENILVQEGHAVVADFGIARAVAVAGGERLTQTGATLGTPTYMSPEQAMGSSDLDGRSDLYSLGCVLYEILAGQPPFTGPAAESLVHQHLSVEARPVSALRPSVPGPVVAALSRTLAKTAADRFSTAAEFADALEASRTHTISDVQAPSSPAAVLGRLRRMRGLLGVVALLLALGVGWVVWRSRTGPPATASPGAVAVLPFTVRGSDQLEYLGEGMVDLLSTSLDGAAELRRVDPNALLSYLRRSGGSDLGPERGRAVAQHFGTGLFVLGNILQIGDRLRLQASLYDRSRGSAPIAEGSVEGREAEISSLVDELAVRILSKYTGGRSSRSGRLANLAAVTTHSLPALKAYLDGEQHLRRAQFRPAVDAFRRAVDADSTFGLAWYRLSIAAGWIPGPSQVESREASQRAVLYSGRLTERDRGLLLANEALLHGRAAESERHARTIIQSHPDDVAAWVALSEVLFHGNPYRGRSSAEAREALERAIFLDPENAEPLDHLIRIAAQEHRIADFDSLHARFQALTTRAGPDIRLQLFSAAVHDNRAAWKRLVPQIRQAPAGPERLSHLSDLATGSALSYAEELAAAVVDLPQEPAQRAAVYAMSAGLALGHGKWSSAQDALRSSRSLDVGTGIAYSGFMSAMPFLNESESHLREVRASVERWREPSSADTLILSSFARWHRRLHGVLRTYLLGLLATLLGEDDAALARAAELGRLGEIEEHRLLARDLAAGLRARVAWSRGNAAEALRLLEAAPMRMSLAPPSGFRVRAHERYLRAELLHALGRDEEALGWYDGLGEADLFDAVYLAPSHLQRAKIYEKLGQPDRAIDHYRRFLELWGECDPELRPILEGARQRLDALISVGAPWHWRESS